MSSSLSNSSSLFSSGGVIGITLFADRFGTKIGGAISGLPSTVLYCLLFIAWTQSPAVAVEATTILPAVGGVVALFIACYLLLIKKGVLISLLVATMLWFILALLLVSLPFMNILLSLGIYCGFFGFAYYLVTYRTQIPSVSGKKIVYTPLLILFRGIVSGSIVALAVLRLISIPQSYSPKHCIH